MGKGASKQTIVAPPPQPPIPAKIDELSTGEQQRRAKISSTKKISKRTLLGSSSESDQTTLLKKNILGV
jgi:hypothetical protein